MALGKSLENILGNYFGEGSVSLQGTGDAVMVAPSHNNAAGKQKVTSTLDLSAKPAKITTKKQVQSEAKKSKKSVLKSDVVSSANTVKPKSSTPKKGVSSSTKQGEKTQKEQFAGVQTIRIDSILPNPFQTRTYFDEDKITSLAANIKENGLIQPIVVLHRPNGELMLLAGERRLRACKLLGWQSILSVIKQESEFDDAHQSLISAMENLQREDLSPLELAHTFKMLMNTQKTDENGVASLIEKSVQYVRNYLRLLTLHPHVKEFLNKKMMSEGQARSLVGLDPELQAKVGRIIIEKELTVKEVSRLIENLTNPHQGDSMPFKSRGYDLPQEYIDRSVSFGEYIPNSKIKYFGTKDKGRIVVSWGK